MNAATIQAILARTSQIQENHLIKVAAYGEEDCQAVSPLSGNDF
jgi:hypothetical protein